MAGFFLWIKLSFMSVAGIKTHSLCAKGLLCTIVNQQMLIHDQKVGLL